MPKQFINRKEDAVVDALRGACYATPFLRHLDGLPEVKALVDSTAAKDRVAVVSGGGSGHEPAHVGFIGQGMLAAVAAGDVFASPPTEAVLAAILAVTGPPGCLLIVKNYTGDRLNFGLAAEQAKARGLSVEVVVVGDDCALPGTGLAGRRGLAGTLFVHKIAGAAAASGASLAEVAATARAVAAAVGSMGMASEGCTLPGGQADDRLAADEVEMGLGIHGEPGAFRRPLASAHELVQQVADTILSYMEFEGGDTEYALLVNNLGGASCLELGVLTAAACEHLRGSCGLRLARVYAGACITALDMRGFSLSLLRLQPGWLPLLDAPTLAPAWPGRSEPHEPGPLSLPMPAGTAAAAEAFARPARPQAFGRAVEACLVAAADALQSAAPQLDEWDRRAGDGDCGATVARGAAAVSEALRERMPLDDAAGVARCLAGCCRGMGGTSGALYTILFTAAAGALPDGGPATLAQVARAFQAGADGVARHGGARAGSRTMLDALLPAAEALSAAAEAGKSAAEAARQAAAAAAAGADGTRGMIAAAGRASYVPAAAAAGVPDPGAQAVACWLGAVAEALCKP